MTHHFIEDLKSFYSLSINYHTLSISTIADMSAASDQHAPASTLHPPHDALAAPHWPSY